MAKNHLFAYLSFFAGGLFCFRVITLIGRPILQKTPSTTSTPVTLPVAITAPSATSTTLLPIPIADGKTPYTVAKLLALIQTNSPSSQFLILMTNANGNPIGSQSTTGAGLTGIITQNLNTSVTLQPDTTLAQQLVNLGQLASSDMANYLKILVYFQLSGQRFYLADPFPGVIRSYATMSAGRPIIVTTNPSQLNMQKWNYTQK